MDGQTVELWTYGEYAENNINYGYSFDVPESWLKDKIKNYNYESLKEFYDDYTWDLTELLLYEASNDGVLGKIKCGMFGHEINI